MGIVLGCQHFHRLPCVVFAMRIHNRVCLGRIEENRSSFSKNRRHLLSALGALLLWAGGTGGWSPPFCAAKVARAAKCEGAIVSAPCFAQIPLLFSDVGALPPNPAACTVADPQGAWPTACPALGGGAMGASREPPI